MSERKLQVIHLGIAGFPHKVILAPVQKSYLTYKGLVEAGASVLYINVLPQASPNGRHDDAVQGNLDGIDYVYTCGTPYRSEKFLERNWVKLKGMVQEARLLLSLSRRRSLDVAILYSSHFSVLLYYRCWSKLLGFPLVINYVEYRSSFKTSSTTRKISWFLTDRFAPKLVDGMLPISEFLIAHMKKQSARLPYLKVPTLCNFSRYAAIGKDSTTPRYLLYCGSAAYYEVANFIIESFELLEEDPDVYLYLIINGWPHEKEKVSRRVAQSPKENFIKTFSDVASADYSRLLFQAEGLLIPLRPNIQDTARFPNKVGEYVASGNPMVSTRVGEVAYYFEDNVSAFIAEDYTEKSFAQKMQYLLDHPEEARAIGKRGQAVGCREFDYQVIGQKLSGFLRQLVAHKNAR